MAEQLQIKVGADVSQATRALSQLSVATRNTGTAIQRTGKDFTGLSRVVQDLPYGFNAISNNLTQLVPAAGAAGLAFSGLVAALSFAQIGLQNWVRGNKAGASSVSEHLEKIKKTREALDDYVESLNDIDKVRLQGAQNAQEELVKLQTLYKASQDANVPLAERRKLVDELQAQYPKYFKNLSDETILAGGAENAYKKLSNAILQSARARAAQDTLIDNQKQQLALESQLTDQLDKESRAVINLAKFRKANPLTGEMQGVQGINTKNLQILTEIARAEKDIRSKGEQTAETYKQLNDLRERAKKLSEDILKNVEANGADVLVDVKAKLPKDKKEKFKRDILDQIFKEMQLPDLKIALIPEVRDNSKQIVSQFLLGLRHEIESKGDNEKIDPSDLFRGEMAFKDFMKNGGQVATILDDLKKKMKENLQQMGDDFGQSFVFSIGEGLGNALSGNGFKDIFSPVFTILGSFIQEIGKQMIVASSAMVALKKILKNLFANPVAGIAVGVGLVALGAIIKNSVGKVKAFADGGLAFGPTLGLVGEGRGTSRSNPEVIAPLDKLKGMLGGISNSPDYLPVVEFTHNSFRAWYERGNRSQGRKY